jgi:quercetin dioxygenase-like cupin family protein
MSYPKVQLGCVANLFSRMMHFEKAGDIENGHTHQFDHLTLLASGSLKVTVEGKESIFKAPFMIYIHKDKNHELTALEDNTVAYCIHALRDGNGVDDIIDPLMIPSGVDPFVSGIANPVWDKL